MDMSAFWLMAKPIVAGQLRHFVTVLAGVLIAKGGLSQGDEAAFVEMITGVGMWVIVAGWSWWQKEGQARMLAALAKMKPVASPSATHEQALQAATDALKDVAK